MSEIVKNWTEWLKNFRFSYLSDIQKEQTMRWLGQVRDKVLDRADLKPGDILVDVGTGTGLLAFGAYERLNGTGKVIALDLFQDCLDECKKIAESCSIKEGMEFLLSSATDIKLEDNSVDVIVTRSTLVHILDKLSAFKEFYRVLKPEGRISIFEPIVKSNTKYYELVDSNTFPDYEKYKEIEIQILFGKDEPLTNFDDKTLINDLQTAGFSDIRLDLCVEESTYPVTREMVDPWFTTPPSPGSLNMKQRYMQYLSEEEVDNYIEALKNDLGGRVITVKSFSAYISARK